MANFFYARGDQQFGPFAAEQLKQLAADGTLVPSDLVWQEGGTKKFTAANVRGLIFSAPPVPPPVPLPASPDTGPQSTPVEETASSPSSVPPLPPQEPKTSSSDTLVRMAATTRGLAGGILSKVAETSASLSKKSEGSITVGLRNKLTQATAMVTGGGSPEKQASEAVSTPAAPPKLPEGVSQQDVLAQATAVYQGGHPEFLQQASGNLFLTKSSIYFESAEPTSTMQIEYARVGAILEPKPGSFSDEMRKRAEMTKSAAQAGRVAAGFAGSMIGGMSGRVVRAVGSGVAGSVRSGPPPRNRLVIILLDSDTRHNVLFDVMADSPPLMEEQARAFWLHSAAVRAKFAKPRKAQSTVHTQNPNADTDNFRPTPSETSATPAASTNQSYRLFRNGRMIGTYSPAEILSSMQSGSLHSDDLVCIEAWIPLGTLISFLPASHERGAETQSVAEGQGLDAQRGPKGTGTAIKVAGGAAAGLAAGMLVSKAMHGRAASAAQTQLHGLGGTGGGEPKFMDTDGDGRADAIGLDRDHDGKVDAIGLDTNADGRIDTVGMDKDFDGKIDVVAVDKDGDGNLDTVVSDEDHDGKADTIGIDRNQDGTIDAVGIDQDEDGRIEAVGVDVDQDGTPDAIWEDAPDDSDQMIAASNDAREEPSLLSDTAGDDDALADAGGYDDDFEHDYAEDMDDSVADDLADDDFDEEDWV